ncbi:MAG: anthranilate phosphoribosyltransferase [Kiritimatiellae bacterium]|nr:anthranilate phosphoribosyltransferase [Kiritimatiellia bacterium]
MIQEAIRKLVENHPLSHDEAYTTLREIMSGDTTPAQIASFITALRIRGETPDVIAGSVQAMREKFTAIQTPTDNVVDTCGTGGDGTNTFNISTAAAFVAAGAGITVAKHGNKSVSSRSGSADVLQALGVNIKVSADVMTHCLQEIQMAFLFAPSLHPAMKHAIGPRKEVGIRTIFNILGPLSNPAGAQYGVLGVYDRELVVTMGKAASDLGAKHLFVVHGNDGLDEFTTTTTSLVAEVKEKDVTITEIDPETFNIPKVQPEDLKGGSPEDNADIIKDILLGKKGSPRDIVVLNAAAAIIAGGKAENFPQGIEQAAHSIDSGAGANKLDQLISYTNKN